MMVLFKHAIFGTDMYVDESRVDEYKAAGHKLAADIKPKVIKDLTEAKEADKAEEAKSEPKAEKSKKAPAKKPAAKRTTKK